MTFSSLKIMAIVHSRQSGVSFDMSWLEDLYEQVVLETQANQILPLVINPGRVLLTTARIYFQPYNNTDQVIIVSLEYFDQNFYSYRLNYALFYLASCSQDTTERYKEYYKKKIYITASGKYFVYNLCYHSLIL